MSFGLLLIRFVVGLTLAGHGAQKLFGWFGGYGLAGTAAFFEKIGFRPAKFHAFTAGLVEVGAGLLLALGLFTPFAVAGAVAVMLVAILVVHAPKGFWGQNGGYEYPLVIAAVAIGLAFVGPGAISLDAALGLALEGWGWGIGAAAAGLAGGALSYKFRGRDEAAVTASA